MLQKLYRSLLLGAAALGVAACGGGGEDPKSEKPVEILSFEVDSTQVVEGDSVGITWQTRHADTVELLANGTAVALDGASAAKGEVSVPVHEDTDFVLRAKGAGGEAEAGPVRVGVTPKGALAILSFTATPDEIDEGEAVELAWRTANAETVEIRTSGGEIVDLGGAGPEQGTVEIHPTVGETYTLTATRGDETVTEQATVRIKGAPTVLLQASAGQIDWGESVTLSWETAEAETIRLERDGEVIHETTDATGSLSDEPNLSATYRLVAARGDKVQQNSATVQVRPVILSFEPEGEEASPEGDPVRIHWEVGGATHVTFSNGEGFEETIEVGSPDSGVFEVPMGVEGTFTLVASNGPVSAEAEAQRELLLPPTIASFTTDRAIVSANEGESATVVLSWAGIERAAELVLVADTLGPIDVPAGALEAGTLQVSIAEETHFELTAINAAGDAVAGATVAVVPFADIDAFGVYPAYVGAMEAFDLTWSTTGATSIELTASGMPVEGVTEDQVNGTIVQQVPATTNYLLRAFNDAGDFVEATATVTVGAPQVVEFEVAPNYVAVGGTVTFNWTTLGGRSLEIRDAAAGVVCSTAELAEIDAGTCTGVVPTEGTHAFTLTVANTVGQEAVATRTALASAGPMITSFGAAPDAVTAGDMVTFSWEVVDDPDGATPTLTLTDGNGSYDLSDVDSNQGSKAFVLGEPGTHTFTLTAATAMGSKTETAEVTVHGQPVVSLVASATEYDLVTPITLSWTSEHAASLVLYAIENGGSPTVIHTVPEAARASGSHVVAPNAATTYRAVATNALGVESEDEVTVTVMPPQVLAFTATPDEAVEGDDVVLAWTTAAATEVSLSVLGGMTVHETSEPFIDISATGVPFNFTGTCGSWGASDEGCFDISFPAGFTFPFGGVDRTEARVMANGHLGFDMGFTGNSFSNQRFPSTSIYAGNAHIAPFWDDLYVPNGSMFYEFGADARGQYLIVQWTSVDFSSTADLSFQAILWEDGGFDFRYGEMAYSTQARADGNSATIGYQTPDRSEHYNVSYDTEVEGGLSHRGWSFRHVALEPNGTYTFPAPAEDLTITLTARGPGGTETADVTVTGHPRAVLAVTVPSGELDAGDDLTLAWTSSHADSLVVEDELGATVCVVDAAHVASGSCTFTETVPGTYTYFVKATGALGHEVVEEVEVQFFHPLELLTFEVDADSVAANTPVTLSWAADGAASATLEANGLDVFPAGADPNLGTLSTDPLQEATTFVFTVAAPDGRTRSLTREVEVRTFDLTLTPDATSVAPGTPVTITIGVDTYVAGTPSVSVAGLPMAEVDLAAEPQAAFHDISGTGAPVTMANNYHGLIDLTAIGFSFPFGGESYSVFNLNRSGYITFDPTFDEYGYANTTLPSTTSRGQYVNLAVNWGDLLLADYYYEHFSDPAGDYVIVQWSNVDHDDSPTQDMNFQIVLFEDGRFEYRYGDMLPTDNVVANGGRKTIGYQTPDKEDWWEFHYGAGWTGGTVVGVPGGLSHRTLRYTPFDPSQPMVVTPEDTSTYSVCATLGGYTHCEEVTIEAPWEIVSFEADEDVVDPGQQVTLSWETTNAEVLSLTANGVDIPLSPSTWEQGSVGHFPTEPTTYELTLESLGRTKTETVTVEVRTFALQFDASATSGFPGDSVTLSWNVTSFGADEPNVMLPVFEIDAASSPFVDISQEPAAVELIGAGVDSGIPRHDFANGFLFPFDGVDRDGVRVSSDGYLSFDLTGATSTTWTNTTLPNSGTSQRRIHIAPFWDDLHTRSTGRVHALATDSGSYIFQWSHISKVTGSSSTEPREYDLNFQVELYADGSFEFRYGTMDNHTATASNCYPTDDCVGDANGASATIGYQNTTGSMGQLLHFGGGSQSSSQVPFQGGLSNRSFFVPVDLSGTLTFELRNSVEYTICGELDGYESCETVEIVVPSSGDVVISEIMLDPLPGEPAWFELHNTTDVDLDLAGWTVEIDGTTLPIGTSTVIEAGGYGVVSFGPGVGFVEDLDLGGFALDPTQGSLEIRAGSATIASIAWDAAWAPTPGRSMQVPTPRLTAEIGAGDVRMLCVSDSAYSGTSFGTPGEGAPTHCVPRGTDRYVLDPNASVTLYDIETTGTERLTDFWSQTTVPLGFTFPFFDELATEITVASTGFLTIGPSTYDTDSQPLPAEGPLAAAGLIAPFWDYFSYSTSPAGAVFTEEMQIDGQNVMIVQWTRMHTWGETSNYLTFQAQLWEDGTIVFGYFDLVGSHPLVHGSRATIGIQAPGEADFLEISHAAEVVSEETTFVIRPVP